MHAVTRYHVLLFQYLNNYTFKSYAKHYLSTKNEQQAMIPT